ncbi:MgtC/SapB transporter [Gloeothece citriformis PCC 7424]|uniref:MgtC/SapB transporter n=1 Tax=Gloeothece citriformis (strain PCC 7424) TaxID=65393 RepID=B7KJS6_GLOC7|nr:MgtC/SapB family protein [Gloeothece citriformis]ACK69525.1 MgtC/SapB transporter [Gloeothece citriformis PCC 7424]
MSIHESSGLTLITPVSLVELVFRLGIALLAGIVIGLEREIKGKPAGLRTNLLVSVGSALFVLIPIQLGIAQENPDSLTRAIAGVITGVGFVGAGTILKSSKIQGLTSAVTIWVSAGIGVAIGCGLWIIGLIVAVMTLVILRVFSRFESYL